MLDTAEGVLIALRRCSPDAAFQEVVDAAKRHGVPVFTIASALVEMACDRPIDDGGPGPAHLAAEREWGALLH